MSPFLPTCHLPSSVRQRIGNESIAEAVIGAAVAAEGQAATEAWAAAKGGSARDERALVGWAAAEEWAEL